jgi:hypothetical protein
MPNWQALRVGDRPGVWKSARHALSGLRLGGRGPACAGGSGLVCVAVREPRRAVEWGDKAWSKVLVGWGQWRDEGLTEHRNWWPTSILITARAQGAQARCASTSHSTRLTKQNDARSQGFIGLRVARRAANANRFSSWRMGNEGANRASMSATIQSLGPCLFDSPLRQSEASKRHSKLMRIRVLVDHVEGRGARGSTNPSPSNSPAHARKFSSTLQRPPQPSSPVAASAPDSTTSSRAW